MEKYGQDSRSTRRTANRRRPGGKQPGHRRDEARPGAEGAHHVHPVVEVPLHVLGEPVAELDGELGEVESAGEDAPAPRPVEAAVAARRDKDFVVIARTDARAVEDFDKTVERAQEYAEAGADAIFPEALENPIEFRRFAREMKVPLLANMTEFGKSPQLPLKDLSNMGYRMVIFPQSA